MIQFDRTYCRDVSRASRLEWLETNGLGGYASSSILGLNTRRYHGLLIAALQPPVQRVVLLAKLEEVLIVGQERFELSVNQYPDTYHPEGYLRLIEFRQDPYPVFTYAAAGVVLEKTIFMVHGQDTTVVQYRVLESPRDTSLSLEIRPLIAYRDFHELIKENNAINPEIQFEPNQLSLQLFPNLPRLFLAHNAQRVDHQGFWFHNFQYAAERERGLGYEEDLYSPACFHFDLNQKQHADIIASTQPQGVASSEELRFRELHRRAESIRGMTTHDESALVLAAAAEQFIVKREDRKSILAGYPWFSDWGRDAMIALPGLTLSMGKPDVAQSILKEFSRHVCDGVIPNRFPDNGAAPEYNSADASLWLVDAVYQWLKATQDYETVKANFYEILNDIIEGHDRGTLNGIRLEKDGLILTDGPKPMTWMDAKTGQGAVTLRAGKPVEIQALWFNALSIVERLANQFGDTRRAKVYRDVAHLAKESFNQQFWNESEQCLFDVISNEGKDSAIRPNQVLAVSLDFSMLSQWRSQRVLSVVERELLTPYGLRTLSPRDAAYRGIYAGNLAERDAAYHQGTVWPWLIGPFIRAYLKINGTNPQTVVQSRLWLAPLIQYLTEQSCGQLPEVFDGDFPHRAGGCVAQAWSVAEVLRTYLLFTAMASEVNDSKYSTVGV